MKDGKYHRFTLPDFTVWTAPGQHHEVKHKSPTKYGQYGLEVYRFNALVWFAKTTGQKVYYTIHNHALNGGKAERANHLDHWFAADVNALVGKVKGTFNGQSWVGGEIRVVPIHYWDTKEWTPLRTVWNINESDVPFIP